MTPKVNTDVLSEQIKNLKEDLDEIKNNLDTIRKDLKEINDVTNYWKGGIFVILTLGGILGGIVTFADKIWKFFHG